MIADADDLIVFLRSRLDDDELLALAASPGPWSPNAEHDEIVAVDGINVADGFALSGPQLRATVDHIARHDPARVLADVASKRRIIDEVAPKINAMDDTIESEWGMGGEGPHEETWLLLKLLALPYAGHPDYREEWRP